jgi:hypothetical protein
MDGQQHTSSITRTAISEEGEKVECAVGVAQAR